MSYRDFNDLNRRTAANKVLYDKSFTFKIAKNLKYDGCQRKLVSMVYNFFDKKTSGGATKKEIMQNEELARELHKTIIRKFEKRKVHLSFIDNIWGADLADLQLISKFNKRFRFSLCY